MSSITTDTSIFPLLKRMIKCPNYFLTIPGRHGFVREPNTLAKKFSEADLKSFSSMSNGKQPLKNWRYKRDKNGNKIPKWDDYYQPTVSAAFAIEYVYDPENPVCKYQCKGRCLEGHGSQAWKAVKRLQD